MKELSIRAGYDANGVGLVMGDRNIIMQVELGRTAARERQLPGDVVTKLNGESLAGLRLSELLKQQAEKAAAAEAAAAEAEAAAAARARRRRPRRRRRASALAAATRSRTSALSLW